MASSRNRCLPEIVRSVLLMDKVLTLPKKALAGVFALAVACAMASAAGFAFAATSPNADSPNSATPGYVTESAAGAANAGAASGSAADYVTSPATGVEL